MKLFDNWNLKVDLKPLPWWTIFFLIGGAALWIKMTIILINLTKTYGVN